MSEYDEFSRMTGVGGVFPSSIASMAETDLKSDAPTFRTTSLRASARASLSSSFFFLRSASSVIAVA